MYIGKHVTEDIDDNYMGSGKILKHAIKKYGIESFRKEWLGFYEDLEELNYMERVFVDQTWVDRADTYNIKIGGDGGFAKGLWLGKKRSIETKRKMSKAQKGHKLSQSSRDKIAAVNKGKKRSIEAIEKQKATIKSTLAKQGIWNKGKKCPQISGKNNGAVKKFKGTHYYNNGVIELRAKECPEGFIKGRLHKKTSLPVSADE